MSDGMLTHLRNDYFVTAIIDIGETPEISVLATGI